MYSSVKEVSASRDFDILAPVPSTTPTVTRILLIFLAVSGEVVFLIKKALSALTQTGPSAFKSPENPL